MKKTGAKTMAPYASHTDLAIGACSEVQHPAQPGRDWKQSLAYLSDYDLCSYPYDVDLLATTQHTITLPSAIKYGTIQVSAYGGRDVPGYNDVGAIIYENKFGDISNSGAGLSAPVKWHSASRVSLPNFLQNGHRFKWWAGTTDYNFYDIKSFKVDYTYFVLR